MSADPLMMRQEKTTSYAALIFLFLLFFLAFEIIAWDWWRHGPLAGLDFKVLQHTSKFVASHPWFSHFMKMAGGLGNPYFLWLLAILGGIFLVRKKDWPALLFLLAAAALGNLLVEVVQAWFQRPRPLPFLPGARGFGFPSGGAFLAGVVFGALAVSTWRHLSQGWAKFALLLGALAAALLVGASRLILRLHWLSDVLGAYALAAAWLVLLILIFKKIRR